jgi:hypothetical protein
LSFVRRATAPISIGLLIILAVIAPFTVLRSNPAISPPVLDPNFELWTGSPGERHLVVWRSEYVAATGDSISLLQTTFDHMKALEFDLFKENKSGSTYAFVSQVIDGPRLTALFTLNISAWVMKEACACNTSPTTGDEVFGVELNDGTHVLSYVFSGQRAETQRLWDKRVVFLETPTNQWAKIPLDVARQFYSAQWKKPERLTLGVVFGAGSGVTGLRRAYLHNFTWSNRANTQESKLAAPSLNQSIHATELRLFLLPQRTIRPPVVEN